MAGTVIHFECIQLAYHMELVKAFASKRKTCVLTKNKEKRYKRTQIADYKITGNKIFVLLESKEADDNGKILDYNGNIGGFDYAVLEISKDKNIIMKKRGEIGVFGAGTDIFTGNGNIRFIPVGKETEGMEISMKFSKDSEYTNSTVFEFDLEKNNMSQLFSVEGYSYCSFLCEITEENYEFSEEGEKRNYDLKIENNFYIEDTGLKNAAEKTFIFKKTIKYYAFENGKYILKKEEKSLCWIQMKTVVRPDGSIISDIFHICFLHYFAM